MSKNHKIRQIAEKLPQVPKLHPNGNVQFDGKGEIIMLNHFREISKIYDDNEGNEKLIQFLCGKYMTACYEYEDMVRKHQREVKIKKAIIFASEVLLVLIITAGLVKLLWPF
jgi:hypothetical protein